MGRLYYPLPVGRASQSGPLAFPIASIATFSWHVPDRACILHPFLNSPNLGERFAMLPRAQDLEGKPVPKVTFKTRQNEQWRDVSSDEIFNGKKVVVFSLPGAYTPTCSSTHLPRYN